MTRGVCLNCHEPVLESDDAVMQPHLDRPRNIDPTFANAWEITERYTHRNCEIRMVIGSVGHQLGQCTCYRKDGKGYDDPPGLTKRQAADAAAELFRERQSR